MALETSMSGRRRHQWKPKVMNRPMIHDHNQLYLGWDETVQKTLLTG